MKKLLSLSTLIALLTLFSCSDDNQVQLDDSANTNSEAPKNKSLNNKSSIAVESRLYPNSSIGEILIVHDKVGQEVYFLQLNTSHSISEFTGDDAYLSTDEKTLFVQTGSDLSAFTFGSDIFGVGSIGYSSAQNDDILTYDNEWILNNLEFPPIKCGCFKSEDMPNNCDAGGNNSSGCSISSNGNSCKTSCDSGSDSCCIDDNSFTYDL